MELLWFSVLSRDHGLVAFNTSRLAIPLFIGISYIPLTLLQLQRAFTESLALGQLCLGLNLIKGRKFWALSDFKLKYPFNCKKYVSNKYISLNFEEIIVGLPKDFL